jgi:hypothetical protein
MAASLDCSVWIRWEAVAPLEMNRLNWRRGTFRVWVLASFAWIIFALIKIFGSCMPAARLPNKFECHFSPGLAGDFFGPGIVNYLAIAVWVIGVPVIAYLIRIIAITVAAMIRIAVGWTIRGFKATDPKPYS